MVNALEMGYNTFIKAPVQHGFEIMEDFAPEEMKDLESMFEDLPEASVELGAEEKASEVVAVDLRQSIAQGVEALGNLDIGGVADAYRWL